MNIHFFFFFSLSGGWAHPGWGFFLSKERIEKQVSGNEGYLRLCPQAPGVMLGGSTEWSGVIHVEDSMRMKPKTMGVGGGGREEKRDPFYCQAPSLESCRALWIINISLANKLKFISERQLFRWYLHLSRQYHKTHLGPENFGASVKVKLLDF